MGQAGERQVDQACAGKSGNATHEARNASRTRRTGDETSAGETRHAASSAAEAWPARHPACAEPVATEADESADNAAIEAGAATQTWPTDHSACAESVPAEATESATP